VGYLGPQRRVKEKIESKWSHAMAETNWTIVCSCTLFDLLSSRVTFLHPWYRTEDRSKKTFGAMHA